MARIRTIKPEFPQSESMGRVSRDARLCFINLWTISDDAGRARGNSRMLASLLFPYDDDAPVLIERWLSELEREGCIVRYEVDGSSYLQISKWLEHQKIDKPSASRLPPLEEGSRTFANIREPSSLDLVPSTLDLGSSSLRSDVGPSPPKRKSKRGLPEDFPLDSDRQWAETMWLQKGRNDLCNLMDEEIEKFRDYHVSNATTSADWPASWRTWVKNAMKFNKAETLNGKSSHGTAHDRFFAGALEAIEEFDRESR